LPSPSLLLQRSTTLHAAFLSVAILLTVADCESTTAPDCPLDGSWAWEWNRNPSGSNLDLVLTTAGDTVLGTGVGYGVGPDATADSITISGTFAPHSGSFGLTLSYRSGRVVTYTGKLVCPDKLQGTATAGGSPYALVFYRGVNPLPGRGLPGWAAPCSLGAESLASRFTG
jgi:hypothetical protein